jgi:hypothetical protein
MPGTLRDHEAAAGRAALDQPRATLALQRNIYASLIAPSGGEHIDKKAEILGECSADSQI